MADREVTHSRKDEDGDITALCNPGSWWSPHLKSEMKSDFLLSTFLTDMSFLRTMVKRAFLLKIWNSSRDNSVFKYGRVRVAN